MPDQIPNDPFDDSVPSNHEPNHDERADYPAELEEAERTGAELDDAVSHMPVPDFVNPLMTEPPFAPDDTQPRAPVGLRERLAAEEPPFGPDDTQPGDLAPAAGRWILVFAVMAGTLCLCALMVGSASFLGYRDGLATNDAKVTQTLATGIAEQYATGVVDLAQGYEELAVARFEWIVETIQAPTEYAQDSAMRLAIARTRAAYTATPEASATATVSPTPAEPTATDVPPTEVVTATVSPSEDPDYLYRQAEIAAGLARYEEAIEWLDALFALAPNYARAAEAKAMLMHALTEQGKIYLRGQNEDGEDMLLRGVQLVYRAQDLGEIPSTLYGEAIFVENYLNARSFINGGNYAAALPILQDLCNQNCGWGYPNVNPVTVRDLLDQAQSGGQ